MGPIQINRQRTLRGGIMGRLVSYSRAIGVFFKKRLSLVKASQKFKIGLIAGSISGITLFHYSIGVNPLNHQIYGKFFYVPVLVSGLWFGLKGGILVSVLVALLLLAHFFIDWGGSPGGLWGILLEIPPITLAGVVTGYLSDKESQGRAKLGKVSHLASVGRASSLIAHEVKNIGISIVGFARLINRKANLPEETARMLGVIEKESLRMERLAREILLSSPNPVLKKERVNLDEFVDDILSISRGMAGEKGIKFHGKVMKGIPSIELDLDRMKEVMLNLIQNAIQATPPGGTVTLRVLRVGQGVKIQISDTGNGIPRNYLDKIFLPYFTTKIEGHGLGLTLCKNIVEAHGAVLKVDSREGTGTQFDIVFPPDPGKLNLNL